jgi:hypothetical protein
MAEFDPDAFLKSTSKKTDAPSKGFDPDAFLGRTSTTKQEVKQLTTQPSQPTSTSAFGTFAREAGLNVPATMAAIGASEAATAATAPVLGPAAPVAGLVVGGAVGFGVNYLGEAGMDELESMGPVAQKIMQTLGVDKATRTAGRKEHEYAALGGQLASGGPFMSTAAKNVGQRVVGGGINVSVGAGSRAAFGEDQDIKKSAMEFGAGFAMPGTLSKTGERIPGVRKTEPTTPTKKPTTPEEIEAFKTKVKEEKAKRDATAPLVEAAIRNKKTGEIERMGPKHDPARKAETIDTHDQGFVDERGNFHERQAAVDQAKRAGQLPEDHALEIPEDGLHSGDLRKVGDERFAVTEDQPAGVPKEAPEFKDNVIKLKTSSEPLSDAEINKALETKEGRRWLAENTDFVSPELAAVFKNPTDFVARRTNDLMVEKQEKLYELYDRYGESEENILKSKDAEQFIKLKEEYQTLKDSFKTPSAPDELATKEQPAVRPTNSSVPKKLSSPEIDKLISELPPVKEGNTRVFRGQYTGPKTDLPEWIKVSQDESGHTDAQGRWWTTDPEVAKWYMEDSGEQGGIVHQEVPTNIVEESQVTKADPSVKRFSREPEKELFLPKEFVGKGILLEKTSEPVAKAFEKVDPRSMPSEEEMIKHATDIHERFGEEEAIKFFEDYKKDLNERSIPIPHNIKDLYDTFHKMNTFEVKDRSEMVTWMDAAKAAGVTPETAEKWFFMLEDLRKLPDEATKSGATAAKIKYWESLIKEGKELPADAKKSAASYDQYGREVPNSAETKIKGWFDILEKGRELPPEAAEWLQEGRDELVALVRKAKAMGLDVGEEFVTGQSRMRLWTEKEKPGWKETVRKFFDNDTPMGDKIADQANAAIERKVYQTTDGRVIELKRYSEDTVVPVKDKNGKKIGTREVKKGTEVWEWKDGNKKLLTHSSDLNLKRGDKIKVSKLPGELPEPPDRTGSTKRIAEFEPTIIDGNVGDIEKHSPYRYLHDALASQAMARMGLRKMVREAEFVENLKKSELFKQIGHGPEQDLKTLPKHWVVPSSIDRIPQLRGWHFDPKAAAIISDFAKVWDNGMYMKLSNALVKNMMLNPVPHMFNEVMHLWNARGFTGWVDPRRLGTFAETSRAAWRDVGNQTQFFRDIMREGGSILSADPRNKGYFEPIIKQASQEMFGTPEMERSMGQLAKKLGTTVGDLYNGISTASNKAMWFTRDVMYVQLIREIMKQNPGWELKEAINHAERHMPNYRLPPEVLGSRALSQVLRDPRVSMFSRYHYGMVKSLVNTIKDVNPKNLSTPEGRAHFREGVDSMLAIGVAMGIMYPLMDKMAEAMFGEGAEQRRAGPYHMIQAAMDVGANKKDASALIWPVFTFNPMLLTLAQLGFNKKIFTGKQIYHPEDDLRDKASDVGKYLVGQVPQASPVMSATSGEEGGTTKLIARQLDIKAKTEAEKAREKRAKELQARTKKSRDTKRERKEYIP